MSITKKQWGLLSIFVVLLLVAAQCAVVPVSTEQQSRPAAESHGPNISIEEPFANTTTANGAVYLKLVNTGDVADTLVSAETDVADAVELHETRLEGEVMKMSPLPGGIQLPAGETVTLEPGGLHIMLIGLTQDLAPGDKISLTLNFKSSDPVSIEAEVREGVAMAHEHEAEAHEHEAGDEEHEHEMEATALAPVDLAEGEKLQVIATTSIVADIVRQVGGDRIDLTMLLPVGADPHTFQPTPRDLTHVADAHVIFANGMGLEEFLNPMIANAGGEAVVIHVSDGIEPRQFETGDAHEHEQKGEKQEQEAAKAEQETEDHEHEGADPHTWTTPANAIVFVHNIEHALSALDPANAASYAANAEAYAAELAELDGWVKMQIETIPVENRLLVTDHLVFGYYADRYGLKQLGAVIPSFSTGAAPSAKELVELEDAIRAYGVKAIFVGSTVNPSLSERVAQDTGIRLLTVYTGSLGPAGSGVETYLDYIKYNTNTIVAGLK
jgi:manganese/iron transport system substrate-binding protein